MIKLTNKLKNKIEDAIWLIVVWSLFYAVFWQLSEVTK